MKDEKDAPRELEIVSLNTELMSFDIDDLSIEELEQRLEMAIAVFDLDDCGCNGTNCGCNGTNCGCNGTNCGSNSGGEEGFLLS